MFKVLATGLYFVALLGAAQTAAILKARDPGPVDCRDDLGAAALGNAQDSVSCINQLAARGSDACNADQLSNILCQQGNTAITILNKQLNEGGTSDPGNVALTCNDVAQAAGHIMDICTRGDGTVRGSTDAFDNSNVIVDIRGL
ncbi:hypothetical protein HDU87_007138 [Geranomyces variabilis]|uniref:Uncharacterized protein n=1 Tax=Geranomyces variabilis TaxID=109894 RepID=A0AAD5XJV9_9FUNG|nr:hypothetical protein HDU87_007138 [Geranomyces variabilis]